MSYPFKRAFANICSARNSSVDNSSRKAVGRDIKVFPEDVYIVSYPKSGNTWLRFLVANLLTSNNERIGFSQVESLIPDIYKNNQKDFLSTPAPRYIKSHEYFDPRYPKVVYIVRDPRDVAVSYYHYLIKIGKIEASVNIDAWISDFIEGKYFPSIGTWAENVGSWIGSCERSSKFFMIRYEDLLQDTFACMEKLSLFLDINTTKEKTMNAITASSAGSMRKMEIEENWIADKNDFGSQVPFVRSATAGEGKQLLSQQSNRNIESSWSHLMKKLGYLRR